MSKTEVDLGKQTILAAIPIPITQIYAFYKIKKTIIGIAILVAVYSPIWLAELGPSFHIPYYDSSDLSPNPWSFFLFSGIMVYFVRRWTRQYNSKLASDG